jgi:hypothetical protein
MKFYDQDETWVLYGAAGQDRGTAASLKVDFRDTAALDGGHLVLASCRWYLLYK